MKKKTILKGECGGRIEMKRRKGDRQEGGGGGGGGGGGRDGRRK